MDAEILGYFKEEAREILAELEPIVEKIEEGGGPEMLAQFAQRIDRIMGSAKTLLIEDPSNLALKRIGDLSSLCKTLGYKAAAANAASLLPFFAAFWADTLEVISGLVEALGDPARAEKVAGSFAGVLQKRLEWLFNKLSAAAPGEKPSEAIAALLKELGMKA